jgi:uncharacterized protein YdcH (DUF465 family)
MLFGRPMSEAHHDLAHEYPEHKEKISSLKSSHAHFANLLGRYHEVVKTVHRIEAGVEAADDAYTTGLKRQRLHLKEELFAMLQSN